VKPTSIPLTVRRFDSVRCGVCFGCGCACGYIAYLKDGKPADVYGHPHHPNNVGSLCSRGITLLQKARSNPLRLKEPVLREGSSWRTVSAQEVLKWMERELGGKVGVFLGRLTDLRDYVLAHRLAGRVFGDAVYLPFSASTIRPRRWAFKRVILVLECEPVFSEPMTARWLVDEASRRLLLKPPLTVRFLTELADTLEGKRVDRFFSEETEKLSSALLHMEEESLIVIGDTLLRSPWRDNLLHALRRIRSRLKVDYTFVGDLSPFEMGELPDFLSSLEEFDSFLLFGNPAAYMSDEQLSVLKEKKTVHLTHFPNLTSHFADLVVPITLFPERDFVGYRTSFGVLYSSPRIFTPPEGVLNPSELMSDLLGVRPDLSEILEPFGGCPESLEEEEGFTLPAAPVESWEGVSETPLCNDDGVFLVCDSGLTDEIGHWSLWTHELEADQELFLNPATAKRLGADGEFKLRGKVLRVRTSPNVAEDVVFLPMSFEETQPFSAGIRPGSILRSGGYRVERL